MRPLTDKEQTCRVAYLGFSFMIVFTAFNSLQNIVSKLYDQYHYDNLGQAAVIIIYLMLSLCTFITSFVIKKFGYKKSMLIASLGYAVFECAGLIIASGVDLPAWAAWTIVCFGAALCGASASVIWVAQGSYTSIVAGEGRKSQLFALFWSFSMSSQIFGNLLTTFVLGQLGNFKYFIILTSLGTASASLFLFLPDSGNKQSPNAVDSSAPQQSATVKQEVFKILRTIKDPKYRYLFIYYLFPGLTIGFYAGFLYKIIKISLPVEKNQTVDQYNQRLSFNSGLVFIALGCSQLFSGIMLKLFSQRFCKFKQAIIATLVVEIAGFTSLVAYFLGSYPLCFVSAFLWGCSETFLQSNTGALIAIVFPGKVEAYSVFRVIFGFGVVITILISIALTNSPPYIFLGIILIVQVVMTAVSIKLGALKESVATKEENSLIEGEDADEANIAKAS